MGEVIHFKPPDEVPHSICWLACMSCGFVATCIWPSSMETDDLECAECGEFGLASVWNRHELLPYNEAWRAEIEAEQMGEEE